MNEYNIIAPSYLKKALNKTYDKFKFFSSDDVIKILTYSYDMKAVYYVYKKYANNNYSLAKILVQNAALLKDEDISLLDNPKIKELYLIRDDLVSKGLFTKDELYSYLLKKRENFVYGYEDNKPLLDCLKDHHIKYEIKDLSFIKPKKEVVTIYDEISIEMIEVLNKISFDIGSLMSFDGIEVIMKSDYMPLFSSLAKMSGIPVKYDDVSLMTCPFFIKAFDLIKNNGLESLDSLENEDDSYKGEAKKALKSLLNPLYGDESIDFILSYLKTEVTYKSFSSKEGLKITSDFSDKDTSSTYLLSFDDSYPRMHKNDDYLSDVEKTKYSYLETSYQKNSLSREELLNKIYLSNDIHISFSEKHPVNGLLDISSLVQDEGWEVKRVGSDGIENIRYTHECDLFVYSVLHSDYLSYGEDSYFHQMMDTYFKDEYKKFKPDNLNIHSDVSNMKLSYSFSSLTDYMKCPFSYLVKRIYKIEDTDQFKEALDRGNVFHKLVEEYGKGKILSYDEILKEIELDESSVSNKEAFYLNKTYNTGISFLKDLDRFRSSSSLTDLETEVPFQYELESVKATMKGKIDAIYSNDMGFIVVDYKTGNHTFSLDDVVNGFDMQLPFYTDYLIKNHKEGNKKLFGMYFLTPFLNSSLYCFGGFKYLSGYSLTDEEKNKLLVRFSKDADSIKDFISNVRVDNIKDIDYIFRSVEDNVEKGVTSIQKGDFPVIKKSYVNKANIEKLTMCKFCKLKDICMYSDDNGSQKVNIHRLNEKDGDEVDNDEEEESDDNEGLD